MESNGLRYYKSNNLLSSNSDGLRNALVRSVAVIKKAKEKRTVETLLASELMRLRRDEAILERMHARLDQAGPGPRRRFVCLLAETQERVNWLDRMLDGMSRSNAPAVA